MKPTFESKWVVYLKPIGRTPKALEDYRLRVKSARKDATEMLKKASAVLANLRRAR